MTVSKVTQSAEDEVTPRSDALVHADWIKTLDGKRRYVFSIMWGSLSKVYFTFDRQISSTLEQQGCSFNMVTL